MASDTNEETIFDRAEACLDSFQQCFSQLQLVEGPGNALIEDQLGRFNIWTSNIGVFAPGRASMDYRLRDAHDIRGLVLRLLDTLLGHVQDCTFNSVFIE
jgi:hypothetical protein